MGAYTFNFRKADVCSATVKAKTNNNPFYRKL